MIPMTTSERKTLDEVLVSSHSVHVKVYVTDLAGKRQSEISDRLMGGQIDVDTDGDVSRTLQLTLFDPEASIAFDSNDPSEGAMYMSNMIEVHYGVKGGDMTEFFYTPVFKGPIVSLSRTDESIAVTAYGKEHLARGALWHNFNAKKGANKVDVIKRLMKNEAGETHFALPEAANSHLADDYSLVALRQSPWEGAQKIARSMNRVLFYDGSGNLRMRPKQANVAYTFAEGDEGMLLSVPNIQFDTSEARNAVVVKGRKTKATKGGSTEKGSKTAVVVGRAIAPRNHPLSPWSLGRPVGGEIVPRYLHVEIENDKVSTRKSAEELAETELRSLLEQQVQVSFDAAPVPYLEEYDRVALEYQSYQIGGFGLRQFSIPLTIGDAMTIGYNRRLLTVKNNKNRPHKRKASRKRD